MPNWCTNVVTLLGSPSDIAEAKEMLQDAHSAFSLNNIVPMPQEYNGIPSPNRDEDKAQELKKKFGHPDWFSWAVHNWGTKWDVDATIIEEAEDFIDYNFDSAWSPPYIAIKALSAKFPEIHITMEYDEPGMDFWGIIQYLDGVVISEIDGPSRINEEALLEDFENELETEEDVPDEDF